ncbi:hypothetical protein D3C75_890510 [compost metagenome]
MREVTAEDIPGLKLALEHCTKYEDRMWFSFLIGMYDRKEAERLKPRITINSFKQIWNKSWQYQVTYTGNGESVNVMFYLSPTEWPTDDVIRMKMQSACYQQGLQLAHVLLHAEVVRIK